MKEEQQSLLCLQKAAGTSGWPESEVGTESGEAEEKAPIPLIAKSIKTLVL